VTDLAAWLLEQITEDEADAREASDERLWRWSQHGDMIIADSGHMQRFTPARMLAECAAKRRMVTLFSAMLVHYWYRQSAGEGLRILALPYRDRPGWRDEWAVET
jgi:hypothetical protein